MVIFVIVNRIYVLFCLGIVRGTGWQKIGAYVNITSYYLIGIPVGLLLCFHLHFNGKGLWAGLVTGSTLQTLILFLVIGFTNWRKEVIATA